MQFYPGVRLLSCKTRLSFPFLWRSQLKRFIPLLAVFTIVVALILIALKVIASSTGNFSTPIQDTHIIGGFSIDTPARLSRAAADGVQVVFYYGQPPSESSALGQKLKSLHMKVIDGFIS
jgi:hypothetical protein